MTMDTGPVCRTRCACLLLSLRQYQSILPGDETMCVNGLPKVALDSAAAVIEPAISDDHKFNALTIETPPSHTR